MAASVQLHEEDCYEQVQAALQYALQAMHFEMRPIHLNMAFDEPLYEQGEAPKSIQLNSPDDIVTKYGLPMSPNFPLLEDAESVAVIAGQLSPKDSRREGCIGSGGKLDAFRRPDEWGIGPSIRRAVRGNYAPPSKGYYQHWRSVDQ